VTTGLDRPTRLRLAVPAACFLLYVLHLAFWSPKPFLTRWIEGCFAFFLALVLALVILKNSPAGRAEDDDPEGPDPDGTRTD